MSARVRRPRVRPELEAFARVAHSTAGRLADYLDPNRSRGSADTLRAAVVRKLDTIMHAASSLQALLLQDGDL